MAWLASAVRTARRWRRSGMFILLLTPSSAAAFAAVTKARRGYGAPVLTRSPYRCRAGLKPLEPAIPGAASRISPAAGTVITGKPTSDESSGPQRKSGAGPAAELDVLRVRAQRIKRDISPGSPVGS